jgi:hypothetical protein
VKITIQNVDHTLSNGNTEEKIGLRSVSVAHPIF